MNFLLLSAKGILVCIVFLGKSNLYLQTLEHWEGVPDVPAFKEGVYTEHQTCPFFQIQPVSAQVQVAILLLTVFVSGETSVHTNLKSVGY